VGKKARAFQSEYKECGEYANSKELIMATLMQPGIKIKLES